LIRSGERGSQARFRPLKAVGNTIVRWTIERRSAAMRLHRGSGQRPLSSSPISCRRTALGRTATGSVSAFDLERLLLVVLPRALLAA
jgi:hypothetical protein